MDLYSFEVVADNKSYTLYKWGFRLKRSYTVAFKITNRDSLRLALKLGRIASEYKSFMHSLVFYTTNGCVYSLLPKSIEVYDNIDLICRESIFDEVLWLDIPQIFPIISETISSAYGLGQVIYQPDYSVAAPVIAVSNIKGFVRKNSVSFIITVPKYTDMLQDISLRFRILYYSMYTNDFDVFADMCDIDKEFDCVKNFTDCDKAVKYCIRNMSIILYGLTDEEATIINRCFRGINTSIWGLQYPLEYKIEKVNNYYQLSYYIYEYKGYQERRLRMYG